MGRMYAGVMGPLAFSTIIIRSLFHASGPGGTLTLATICLFAFAALGYLAGRIAEMVVIDTVQTKINEEIQAREEAAATTDKQGLG